MEKNVEIRCTPEKGRCLYTKVPIQSGDVILEEEPLIAAQFSWNALCKYDACEYCLRSLETAQENARRLSKQPDLVLPFPECCEAQPLSVVECSQCGARYCNEACRREAYQRYHKALCEPLGSEGDTPLKLLDSMWRETHFPPETTTIALVTKLLALVIQSEDKQGLLKALSSFCNRTRDENTKCVHKLLGAQFEPSLDTLLSYMSHIEALVDPSTERFLTADGFRSLFALIGTNGQGIGTSSLSVWVSNCDSLELDADRRRDLDGFIDGLYEKIDQADKTYTEDGMEEECTHDAFLNCEGSGLYLTQSAANHSCQPNAQISFPYNNSTLRLTALSDIPTGEEVSISYLDECMLGRSRHSRQKYLGENYLFICDCSKCQSERDQPDVTSDEEEEEDDDDEVMDE